MSRRLLILNTVLVLALISAGMKLRQVWLEAKGREQAILSVHAKPLAAPKAPAAPAKAPITPASYLEVAQKMLFSKDRNPDVVIEVPPEEPLPPLPRVHGVMNLGDGLTVIMSEKAGERHHGVQVGQSIGPYKLAAIEGEQLVFTWKDKTVKKRVDELISRREEKQEVVAAPSDQANTGAPRPGGRIVPETPASKVPAPKAEAAPGKELSPGISACQPGDDSPAGTEKDGKRKVITKTPFGESCRWETAR
jgi:hypothetical protein